MTSIRVIVIEDDATVASDLARRIERSTTLRLAGTFAEGASALAAVRKGLGADVALVDLGLPRMPGQDVISALRAIDSRIEALVLTVLDDDESLYGALRAGASGYLLKDGSFDEVLEAVLQVHRGGAPMTPSIARRVLVDFRSPPAPDQSALTAREREVLELLTRGCSYPMIGTALTISTNTVQTHIRSIYRKLEVSTKAEAAAEAYKRKIVR